MKRYNYIALLAVAVTALVAGIGVFAQPAQQVASNSRLDGVEMVSLEDGATFNGIGADLQVSTVNQYFVQLEGATAIEIETGMVNARGVTAVEQISTLEAAQDVLSAQVAELGGATLGTYQRVFNGIAIEISADRLQEVASLPGVVAVHPVLEYSLHLDETVPWIGAEAAQMGGFDGTGITVAVLDSGIDYTHEHLGGSGLITDTAKAIAEASQVADPALYPTAKVVGGYDFTGSVWPDGPLMPDSNPMDDEGGPGSPNGGVDGHGTHVASIIAGVDTTGNGGIGPGVAPGAELYAVKVCSSVSTSCSGVAIANGYEYVTDPNGDGNFSDRVDIVNLSLGSNYGQTGSADDSMINLMSAIGIVTVASAGNSANTPYIVGSPSSAETAISVAQSSVPSAFNAQMEITSPISITGFYDVVRYTWTAEWTEPISGEVVYVGHTGCDGEAMPAEVAGNIALIDRGGCFFSDKVYNAQAAGATAALVGLVAPGEPFAGGFGVDRGEITIVGFNIAQVPSEAMKGVDTPEVLLDPTVGVPLPDTMVGSSSRGPRFDLHYIKPEISAPGASNSANSGDQGYSIFGGTSGAAPMVAGAAALVLEANGGSASLPPHVVKAMLMNTAETITWEDVPGGMLNPITRQGAGRVDVYNAINTDAIMWVPDDNRSDLSFGFEEIGGVYSDTKTVQVINTYTETMTYTVATTYRYADDIPTGVNVTASTTEIVVPAGGTATFDVELSVDGPEDLKDWAFSGSSLTNPAILTDLEVDGFVTLHSADGNARVRAVHASPDAPAVDIYVDGALALEDVPFTGVSDYLVVPAGSYLLQVTAANAPLSTSVLSETVALPADTDVTIAAVGSLFGATFTRTVHIDNNVIPADQTAHIRVAHLNEGAPAVDIVASNDDITATLFSNLAYSTTEMVTPVPAGTYLVEVQGAGSGTTVLSATLTLEDGVIYTVNAMGAGLEDLQLVVAEYRPDGDVAMPFHFLPRKGADVGVDVEGIVSVATYTNTTAVSLTNTSGITASVEVWPLFEINPANNLAPGNDLQPVDLACVGSDVIGNAFGDGRNLYYFPISTHEYRSHPMNIINRVYVDLDQDGTDDWLVQNEDLGDGRWVSVQYDLSDPSDPGGIFFILETTINTSYMNLYLLTSDDDLAYNFRVEAYDAYYGDGTFILQYDQSPMAGGYHTHDAAAPAFIADDYSLEVGPNSTLVSNISALANGTTQMGMMYRNLNGVDEVSCVEMAASDLNTIYLPLLTTDPPSIAEIAAADPQFSTLVTALSAADLVTTLASPGDYTVFAPTNDAFAKIPADDLGAIISDTAVLTDILLYHVVAGTVPASTVVTLDSATTLQGSDVTISIGADGNVYLNGNVQVIVTDIQASNGIIHVIDTVLIPPSN